MVERPIGWRIGLDKPEIIQYHLVMEPSGYSQAASCLDTTFAALADPTRRAILARLALGEASVTELAGPFSMTQPAISKHLRVLERAGLISRDRVAQRRPRRLEAKPLAEASRWLEEYRKFWEASFTRLEELLGELQSTPTKGGAGAAGAIKGDSCSIPTVSSSPHLPTARSKSRETSTRRGRSFSMPSPNRNS